MTRRRTHEESDDHIARSVLESPGTEDRTRQEHRIGSGNRRGRQAQAMRKAGVISNSKTGPDRSRPRSKKRTNANKRAGRL